MLQQRAVTAPRQVKAPRPVMTTQNRPYLSDLDPRQRRREERRAAPLSTACRCGGSPAHRGAAVGVSKLPVH
jgi:hypothetical protein